MKPLRFLPLVALAAFALLGLKLAGLLTGGGYMLTGTQVTQAQDAKPADNKAEATKGEDGNKQPAKDAAAKPKDDKAAADKKADDKNAPPKDVTGLLPEQHRTKGEIALLSSLSKRRQTLDAREKKLDLRLALLKAAQKRIDERISVLRELKNKVERYSKQRDDENKTQFARLVKMYSGMKPKDAARIFNELDNKVLLGLIRQMKPQNMSAILAAMDPERARETTIALAGASQNKMTDKSLDELPKIQGQ